MYQDLDPNDPKDAPILLRWQRAQEIRAAVESIEKEYLADLYEQKRRGAAGDIDSLISSCLDYNTRQLREAHRLEQGAATLYSMLDKVVIAPSSHDPTVCNQ